MLKNYINDQVVEVNVEVKNWEEAVRLGGKLLEEDGAVEHSYIDAMVDTVKKHGTLHCNSTWNSDASCKT